MLVACNKIMTWMVDMGMEERAQMGLTGRKHMENVFDKKKVVEKMLT